MYKAFITLGLLLVCQVLGAQSDVINDDCESLVDLGVAPSCTDNVYHNLAATPSNIGFGNIPSCFADSVVNNDVWFAFKTADTVFNYMITLTGMDQGTGPIVNPQIAMYRGGCGENGLAELLCGAAETGSSELELSASGLTPNVTYYLRIDHYVANGTGKAGYFQLCVEELQPTNTIDEGGSTACSGRLFDSGGADGNYQSNEDYTFTICPDEPQQCINFTLDYYHLDPSEGDQLIFYRGNSTNFNNIIAQFGGFELEPGGGVCFEVQSDSDCLTVRFRSNNSVNLEGFAGSWNCSVAPCKIDKPISVAGNIPNSQIVDFISTPQTVVDITNITCPPNAYGTFLAGDSTNLGLQRGLLLTTGDIQVAPGPNTVVDAGVENNAPGDPDLDYLSKIQGEGSLSGDACIVELDVFAATNELTFEYIFASEEYPEFVNTEFNDIFAFFISGPGIVGDPNIGNQLNIAVLPGGDTPVQINSVSHLENWQYFRNNELGRSLEYDGLIGDFLGVKKSLTARAQVEPCQTYHLKLAIADRRDYAYDSGVFISELRGGAPSFRVAYQSGIDFLIEDCTTVSDTLYIGLNSPLADTVSYQVRIGGTATPGEDYLLDIPNTITFLPGQTSIGFPITPLSDQNDEPLENIRLSLTNNFGCGEVTYTTIDIELRDKLEVEIAATGDTILQCRDSTLLLTATGAADYFWTPAGIFSNPQDAEQAFTLQTSGWVAVEGKIGNFCLDTDSVYIDIVNVTLDIQALDPTSICLGDSVRVNAVNNIGDANLQWFPTIGVQDTTSAITTIIPDKTTRYIARVSTAGCVILDTILLDVSRFGFPELKNDTTICQHSSADLVVPFNPDGLDVLYSWTPAEGLDDPSSPMPTASPDVSTTYTLIVAGLNGGCQASASIRIDVLPADVSIQPSDTSFLCLGNSLDLIAATNTNSATDLVWSAEDGSLNATAVFQVNVQPQQSTWYYTSFQTGICSVADSVFVQVDSLPEQLDIVADIEKEVYCEGETIVLTSPIYDPAFYPDLDNRWLFGLGYQTPDSLYNMVITLIDTFYYERITTNNACVDTNALLIPVLHPPDLSIIPADAMVCAGQPVQLFGQYSGSGNINWSAFPGISCRDCLNPFITPQPGDNRLNLTVEEQGCVAEVSVNVIGLDPPNVLLTIQSNPGDTIFSGEPFELTGSAEGLTFAIYTWEIGDQQTSGTSDTYNGVAPNPDPGQEFAELPVTLIVETAAGCLLSTTITLLVQQGQVKIPNVFTPNGDGINDVFRVYHNTPQISISQFTVYSRWGKAVFQSTGNQGWDGTFNGKAAPGDVYLYHIVYRLGTFGEEQVVRGDVTLLR